MIYFSSISTLRLFYMKAYIFIKLTETLWDFGYASDKSGRLKKGHRTKTFPCVCINDLCTTMTANVNLDFTVVTFDIRHVFKVI